MRIAKDDIPVKMSVPGATARQAPGFGAATGYDDLAAEYFTLASGTDIAPLLAGLEGDLCHAPHWGHLISGEVVVTYGDGSEETYRGGDLYYWPPHHTVRVTADTELVMFSPLTEHAAVIDHMIDKIEGSTP